MAGKNTKADGVSRQGCEEDVVTTTEEEQNQIRAGLSQTGSVLSA